ncbi:MAG TPA: LTA synthase family protein [Methylomirabilota bacterium]
MPRALSRPWSLPATIVFWWGAFVIVQSAERLFLVATTVGQERPSAATLSKTLLTGFRADLIGATAGILIAIVLGLVIGAAVALFRRRRIRRGDVRPPWTRGVWVGGLVMALVILAVTTVDMGYYHYSGQRLDLVFLEYVSDVFAQAGDAQVAGSQVARQTAAELRERSKWAMHVAAFVASMALALGVWSFAFARWMRPLLHRCEMAAPWVTAVVLALGLVWTGTGFQREASLEAQRVSISSSTYYTLAQNPFWYIAANVERAVETRVAGTERELLRLMPEQTAVRLAQATIAPGAEFPSSRYPLVHATTGAAGVRLDQVGGGRPNILMIFVEGLDRRFLDQTVRGVRVTPFLDRLRGESVYFEHFFANGGSTFHGLFASFCSELPRIGFAAIRTHTGNDFLCLPAALRRGGYWTEMVIGQNRDRGQSRFGLFMARNGLDALLDEGDFGPKAPRGRLGVLDSGLFDLMRARIANLQASARPFFLTTLTTSTHHPFKVPDNHPDVRVLREDPDRYLRALRYVDVELERFLTGLQRDGLLRNTVVVILGDHGRHEKRGRADVERRVGHFLAPLFVWLDDSLRQPTTFRPRTVSMIASQVDLPPTILSMSGLMPAVSPFIGRDVSCALVTDCQQDNAAYFTSHYDNLVGVAERDGIWLYSFSTGKLEEVDLAASSAPRLRTASDPDAAPRQQRLLSVYVAANLLLDRNRLWSSKEFATQPSDITVSTRRPSSGSR